VALPIGKVVPCLGLEAFRGSAGCLGSYFSVLFFVTGLADGVLNMFLSWARNG
jgi:hypothetical protein